MTKMKPGAYDRTTLQAALMYPGQASPELKRAMDRMAAKDGKRSPLAVRGGGTTSTNTNKGWRK